MKTEEDYTTEEEFGGGNPSNPKKQNKTNWIAISLIVISLLTILILVSC